METSNMAYSYESSSIKTIVPGAEVSGFCDVVARQKINELSGEVPQLSAGEGIAITTADGKTVITNNISAGSNISLVYDMETNTYRIDAQGGDVFPIVSSDDSTPQYKFIYELDGTASGIEVSYTNSGQYAPDWVSSSLVSPTEIKSVISSDGQTVATGFSLTPNGVSASGGWPLPRYRSWTDLTKPTIQWSDAAPDVASVYGSGALLNLGRNNLSAVLSNSGLFVGAATGYNFSGVYINGKGVSSKNAFGLYTYNQYASWEQILNAATGSQGKTYTGIAPVVVNNNDNTIAVTNYDLSAGPNMDIFPSGGYIVFSSRSDNPFPITGTNGTTGFTANMDCSSFAVSTGAGPAGAYTKQTVRGIQYEAYPSTDVSASWYNIINAANNVNVTCSAVKLTTAASENWFYTSALPNLNEITFIAPSYGPYETYSALIDDGETTFVAEVDSGCCMKVVRNWNDDRNKDCWCGLNQETYFYIG